MNPRTEEDLCQIATLNEEIAERRARIRAIKDACPHLDYKLELVETYAYDLTPARVCVVCGKPLSGITHEEKEQLWREHYKELELELTETRLKQIIDGMNI